MEKWRKSGIRRYALYGHTPVPCEDVLEWAKSFEMSKRRVAETVLPWARVSTVFLGIDHSFFEGPPLLFETMIFWNDGSDELKRYSTWEEAEQGHKRMVVKAKRERTKHERCIT